MRQVQLRAESLKLFQKRRPIVSLHHTNGEWKRGQAFLQEQCSVSGRLRRIHAQNPMLGQNINRGKLTVLPPSGKHNVFGINLHHVSGTGNHESMGKSGSRMQCCFPSPPRRLSINQSPSSQHSPDRTCRYANPFPCEQRSDLVL